MLFVWVLVSKKFVIETHDLSSPRKPYGWLYSRGGREQERHLDQNRRYLINWYNRIALRSGDRQMWPLRPDRWNATNLQCVWFGIFGIQKCESESEAPSWNDGVPQGHPMGYGYTISSCARHPPAGFHQRLNLPRGYDLAEAVTKDGSLEERFQVLMYLKMPSERRFSLLKRFKMPCLAGRARWWSMLFEQNSNRRCLWTTALFSQCDRAPRIQCRLKKIQGGGASRGEFLQSSFGSWGCCLGISWCFD